MALQKKTLNVVKGINVTLKRNFVAFLENLLCSYLFVKNYQDFVT